MEEINGHIRSWADIEKLGGEAALTEAELKLRDAVVAGEFVKLGNGEVPPEVDPGETPDREVHIRAAVLRYFILGGCEKYPSDPTGVWIKGAHITEQLDIDFLTLPGAVRMRNCRIDQRIDMEQARIEMLGLDGSNLNGLYAQGLISQGGVFLRGIKASATVDVNAAKIGGQLNCDRAEFNASEGDALNAQGVETGQSAFLRGIKASATVDVAVAKFGGQLACEGAEFNATKGKALNALGLVVAAAIVWRNVKVPDAWVDFSDANAAVLSDDMGSWPDGGRLSLDGFTYARIIGGPTDAQTRLDWIAKSEMPGRFKPQPYTHLAKVLREMGHDADARKVLMAREQRHNAHIRRNMHVLRPYYRLLDLAYRWIAGYGLAPFRSLIALIILVMVTSWVSHIAYQFGDFAPNSGIIQLSDNWIFLAETSANPAKAWSAKTAAGQDWETFHPLAYAADVVIPIIDFGQTDAWAPSTTRGDWGTFLWWFKWVMTLAGWIVTAIGAAAITGIIRRD